MLKKFVTVMMILSLVLAFGKDFPNAKHAKVLSRSENSIVVEQNGYIHKMQLKKSSVNALGKTTSDGVLDTILRFNPPSTPDAYDDGPAGYMEASFQYGLKDTIIKSYELIAPGTIKKVMMQNASAGTAELQFWGPTFFRTDDSRYVNLPESGYESDGVQVPGSQPFLPYSAPLACTAQDPAEQFNELGEWTPEWNVFDLDALYPGMNPFLTGDSMELWVGYATDGTAGPTFYMDGENQEPVSWGWDVYSHFTLKAYYPDPANYLTWQYEDDAGMVHGSNIIMQIVVEYPAVPPFIENVTKLSNMYTTSATVYADIYDLDSETFTAQIQYKVGSDGERQYMDMSPTGNGDQYEATLSGAVGDTIYYVVKADDGELSQLSDDKYTIFTIKEKPEGKDYLVIREGATKNDSLYQELTSLPQDRTLYWIMDDEGGLHESVVNAGFDVIFVTGFGTTVVPIFDEPDVYGIGKALDNGADLMLCDPDWAFANSQSTALTFVTLQEGDFAYDYMGIDTLVNDPADADGSLGDTEFQGFAEHPVSANYVDGVTYGPLMYSILGKTNWGDFALDNDSEESAVMFVGANNGWPAAVTKANDTYKTVYCGFWPEVIASEQFDEFETLIANILAQVTSVEEEISNVATEFALNQNYPNPFNPTTRIEYSIPERSHVSLKIYDINGNLVRTLNRGMKNEGRYAATWDAKNEFGFKVASGVYFYKLQSANKVMTKKMLLMK